MIDLCVSVCVCTLMWNNDATIAQSNVTAVLCPVLIEHLVTSLAVSVLLAVTRLVLTAPHCVVFRSGLCIKYGGD